MRPAQRLVMTALAVLAAALAPRPASAGPPDFSGTWVLDLSASDPVDDLMRVQGFSFPERQVAARMAVTQTIVQTPDELRIDVESVAKSRREVLHLDGREETIETEKNGPMLTRSSWAPDGATLVSQSRVRLSNGAPAVLRVSRQLRDGGRTLAQRLELEVSGGARYAATRVFRRS